MSQDATSMRTLQPALRAGRAESENRYQSLQSQERQEFDYDAVCFGPIGSHRAEETLVSSNIPQMRTQDVISVMPSQYSFEGGSQSHAEDFGREFLPLQSGGSRRFQSEKNFRANTYNDASRPTRGTSAGLRGPHTRSDWQNHTQNRGNLEWGSMEQTRQPRSWAEGERYARPFIKLPAFTGKEEWKVWINRFEAVDSRKGWTQDEKLDKLLPRIQG